MEGNGIHGRDGNLGFAVGMHGDRHHVLPGLGEAAREVGRQGAVGKGHATLPGGGVLRHRRARQVAWFRAGDQPESCLPTPYRNRWTVVDRENGAGSAVYSTSPKMAVVYPRRIGRRWT